jgi:hypothetical protein
MPVKKETPTTREEKHPESRKELTEKRYRISVPFGRFMLVRDADGLVGREKTVLNVLATFVGGPGVNFDLQRTYVGVPEIAACGGVDESTVTRAFVDLARKQIISRKQRDEKTWWTKVDWLKLLQYSYQWKAMLAAEATKKQRKAARNGDEALSEPMPQVDDGDDLSDLDMPITPPAPRAQEAEAEEEISFSSPAPKPMPEISHKIRRRLVPLVGMAMTYGAAYSSEFDDADQAAITGYCSQYGLEVTEIGGTWRIALPIAEYTALRLSQNSRKVVPVEKCQYIGGKQATDIYSVIEHGLATPSWSVSIPAADFPIALLMHQFDKIRESWIEAGSPTIKPPVALIIDAILEVDPLYKPVTVKVEFTVKERRDNFLAFKDEAIKVERAKRAKRAEVGYVDDSPGRLHGMLLEEDGLAEYLAVLSEDEAKAETALLCKGFADLDPEITGISPEQTIRWQQLDQEAYLYDSELPRPWESQQMFAAAVRAYRLAHR